MYAAAVNGRAHKWWVGDDGNIWANIAGVGVQNLGEYKGVNKNMADAQFWNRIDNPNPSGGDQQAGNDTGNYNPYATSGSSSSYSSSSAEDEALKSRMRGIYDRQIGDINNNLNSMDRQLENALAGVRGEYDTYKNEQQSQYNANKNEYDTSTKQNRQQLQTNRNTITNRASSGLRGLLRILGAMGAGNSSVAQYGAPDMVRRQANDEYNNAGQTYAQNQQNLDTDWGNYQNEYENDKKKLEDWYDGQVKAKKQENYEKRQSLLSDLVTAYGNRAQYGGDYGGGINDAYNRIADYRGKINELGEYSKPNYTGTTAVYNAPDLASYNANDTNLSTTVDNSEGGTTPLLTALRSITKKKNTMGA